MPPLALVAIPTYRTGNRVKTVNEGKAAVKQTSRLLQYDDGPLPVRPSTQAPKNARIKSRTVDDSSVNYTLAIGDVEIHDVKVEEILEYVSALELESFENREFEAEREALRVAEAARARENEEKRERQKERQRRKGTALSDQDSQLDDEDEAVNEAVGNHGRKRPTYTQFYLKNQPRKKGTIYDHDGRTTDRDVDVSSAGDMPGRNVSGNLSGGSSAAPKELQRRRRRKRDKVTGELLPLSPDEDEEPLHHKRPRRRRHPVTGELMPLGWRYNPSEETEQAAQPSSPSFRKLSIADEPRAKRQKFDTESERSRSPTPAMTKAEIAAQYTPNQPIPQRIRKAPASTKSAVVELLSTDESEEDVGVTAQRTLKPLPRSPASTQRSNYMINSALRTAKAEMTSESDESAAATALRKAPNSEDDPDIQGSSNDDEEWNVEAIVDHTMSDPRTHPKELGRKAVPLYRVKWEGVDELSWEPLESFDDLSVVDAYRKQRGLGPAIGDQSIESTKAKGKAASLPGPTTEDRAAERQKGRPVASEDEEDEEYVVERIVAHHLSDPHTHPAGLGKTPVMLYQVKWKGYDELTWEPAAGLAGVQLLNAYNRRHGVTNATASGDSGRHNIVDKINDDEMT